MAKAIPKSVIKAWGLESDEALVFVIEELRRRGFDGPHGLKHKYSFSFNIDPCETIRVELALSGVGAGLYQSSIIVMSRTLRDKTHYRDPWGGGPIDAEAEALWLGYVPCFVDSLAHRKWAQVPGSQAPIWTMTLDGSVPLNVRDWLADFDQLHLPYIRSLTSDAVLVREMKAALDYRKPEWVKSDGPHFVSLAERLAALER